MFCFNVDIQIFCQSFYNLVRAQMFFRGFVLAAWLHDVCVMHVRETSDDCIARSR